MKFIVVTHQRSGSTYFCNTVLNAANNIFCYDELFNQKSNNTIKYLEQNQIPTYSPEKDNSVRDYIGLSSRSIKKYISLHENTISRNRLVEHVGFKLMYNQITHRQFESLLLDEEINIIVLIRKNQLKAAISLEIANIFNQWDFRDKKDIGDFVIDPERINYTLNKWKYQLWLINSLQKKTKRKFHFIYNENLSELTKINDAINFIGGTQLSKVPMWGTKLNENRYGKILNLHELENEFSKFNI